MRLSCDVHVVYSLLTSPATAKPVKATLALGIKPRVKTLLTTTTKTLGDVTLLLCTGKQTKKYEVRNNVLKVFKKYVGHGKATLVLRNPSHQLYISKADPVHLEKFLKLVVLHMKPSQDQIPVHLPELPNARDLLHLDERPKLKLTITQRQNYPLRDGFPSTVETLVIQNCMLAKVDSRIIELVHLRILDLTHNKIRELPSSLANLDKLAELRLAENRLSSFPSSICQTSLSCSLKTLDLSDNQLVSLPAQFGEMVGLVSLNLANNQLHTLPYTFHRLKALQKLLLLNNKLRCLPCNMHYLHLDTLDVSGNEFANEKSVCIMQSRLGVLSLMELCGRVMNCYRIQYNSSCLPLHLCSFLDACRTCMCGKPCFVSFEHCLGPVDSRRMARTVITDSSRDIPMEAFLCSIECKKRFTGKGQLVL